MKKKGKKMKNIELNNPRSIGEIVGFDLKKNKQEDSFGYPKFKASVAIKKMCEQLISSGPGVYFFHDLRGIHYIGETSDLKSRFKSHIRKEKNKKLVKEIKLAFGEMRFSWVKTSSKMEALIYQKKWIRIFKPKCNEIFYKNN